MSLPFSSKEIPDYGVMFTSEPRKAQPSRLPVNPRRQKVPSAQRKRVATACNNCNVRRVKCSGEHPCLQCHSTARQCVYPEPLGNVTISRAELENLQRRCAVLERCLEDSVSDETARRRLLMAHPRPTSGKTPGYCGSPTTDSSILRSSNIVQKHEHHSTGRAEARWLPGPDGTVRYLGMTSDATFLKYLKDFMVNIILLTENGEQWTKTMDTSNNGDQFFPSLGHYQTYDSSPLHETEVDPFWLPSQAEMNSMFVELRYLAQDGNGAFSSGGIYYWAVGSDDGLNEPLGVKTSTSEESWDEYRHLAFYNAVFAVACHGRKPTEDQGGAELSTGESNFKRAKVLIGNPLDSTRYTVGDIPTMALMAFYLLENNMMDVASMYVGAAIHVAQIHGVFNGWADERGKRVFWTLYILDRWVSCLTGRPPILLDDAVRLEMPADVPSLPPPQGLKANIELARITSYIVCNDYSVAHWAQHPLHHDSMAGNPARNHIDRAMMMLESWKLALPESLQLGLEHISNDPAVCNLHMCYNHLVILTARPIFFMVLKETAAEWFKGRHPSSWRQAGEENHGLWDIEKHPQSELLKAGLGAARWNMRIGRWLAIMFGTRRRILYAELHYIFTAAIMIILESLVCPFTTTLDEDVQWAIEVIEDDSRSGSSPSKEHAKALRDFSILARRLTSSFTWGQESINQGAGLATPAESFETASSCSPPGMAPMQLWMQSTDGNSIPGHEVALDAATIGYPAASQPINWVASTGRAVFNDGNLYDELVKCMDTDDVQLYCNFLV